MSSITFIYATHEGQSTLADHEWKLPPSTGGGGGGLGWWPSIDIFELSGGRSRTPDTAS
jgi:hypothetical protein